MLLFQIKTQTPFQSEIMLKIYNIYFNIMMDNNFVYNVIFSDIPIHYVHNNEKLVDVFYMFDYCDEFSEYQELLDWVKECLKRDFRLYNQILFVRQNVIMLVPEHLKKFIIEYKKMERFYNYSEKYKKYRIYQK